jgi:hypothetical protein
MIRAINTITALPEWFKRSLEIEQCLSHMEQAKKEWIRLLKDEEGLTYEEAEHEIFLHELARVEIDCRTPDYSCISHLESFVPETQRAPKSKRDWARVREIVKQIDDNGEKTE